ncbi:hypothetical protein [Congregibacter sp.]|uniref:hypothetical protein n=1 Tax=Congregibacter sp. TaxID=2744308 RepID=UPI003858FBEE
MKHLITIGLVAAISGCASVSSLPDQATTPSTPVTFYRSAQLQGSVTDTFIGWNGDYYLALAPDQATTVNVPSGLTTFRIRAHGDLRSELTLSLHPKKQICLAAEVNPDNIVGVNWLVPGYRLRQVPCLDSPRNTEFNLVAKPSIKPAENTPGRPTNSSR